MEFKNKELGTSFIVPDEITVGMRLDYMSAIAFSDIRSNFHRRSWTGAKQIINDWQSEFMPDIDTDIDTVTENARKITAVIIWATNEVADYMTRQDDIDPNS